MSASAASTSRRPLPGIAEGGDAAAPQRRSRPRRGGCPPRAGGARRRSASSAGSPGRQGEHAAAGGRPPARAGAGPRPPRSPPRRGGAAARPASPRIPRRTTGLGGASLPGEAVDLRAQRGELGALRGGGGARHFVQPGPPPGRVRAPRPRGPGCARRASRSRRQRRRGAAPGRPRPARPGAGRGTAGGGGRAARASRSPYSRACSSGYSSRRSLRRLSRTQGSRWATLFFTTASPHVNTFGSQVKGATAPSSSARRDRPPARARSTSWSRWQLTQSASKVMGANSRCPVAPAAPSSLWHSWQRRTSAGAPPSFFETAFRCTAWEKKIPVTCWTRPPDAAALRSARTTASSGWSSKLEMRGRGPSAVSRAAPWHSAHSWSLTTASGAFRPRCSTWQVTQPRASAAPSATRGRSPAGERGGRRARPASCAPGPTRRGSAGSGSPGPRGRWRGRPRSSRWWSGLSASAPGISGSRSALTKPPPSCSSTKTPATTAVRARPEEQAREPRPREDVVPQPAAGRAPGVLARHQYRTQARTWTTRSPMSRPRRGHVRRPHEPAAQDPLHAVLGVELQLLGVDAHEVVDLAPSPRRPRTAPCGGRARGRGRGPRARRTRRPRTGSRPRQRSPHVLPVEALEHSLAPAISASASSSSRSTSVGDALVERLHPQALGQRGGDPLLQEDAERGR